MSAGVIVREVVGEGDLEAVSGLLREYGQELGLDLSFQGFEREVAELPGRYAPPRGAVLLAEAGGRPVGCVALRPFGPDSCEMKRLYVRPDARGAGVGRLLAQVVVATARAMGYRTMYLDTMSDMAEANALYESLGFRPTAPYYDNPLPGAVYYRLELAD